MHMTDMEWTLLELVLENPDKVSDMLPTWDAEEIEARCFMLIETREFDERDPKMRKIIEACINNGDWHIAIHKSDIDYDATLDIVDAAFSLQDRFAARFPVDPGEWFAYVNQEVDGLNICH